MATQFTLPRQVKINVAGRPYAGAQAFFYQTATEVAQPVYQDNNLSVLHPQPVVADDDGYFPMVWLDQNAAFDYRVKILSSNGSLLDDVSDIPPRPMTSAQIIEDVTENLDSLATIPAETAAGITIINRSYAPKPYDLRRVGLVANNPAAATANTNAWKSVVDPSVSANGPVGRFILPNIGGNDTYHFNDFTQLRRMVALDLDYSRVLLQKTRSAADDTMALFTLIGDAVIENGLIELDYDGTGGVNAGLMFRIGSRLGYKWGSFTGGVEEEDLTTPMGNVVLRNLRLKTNNPAVVGNVLIGGLRNVRIETVTFDGQGAAPHGFYYEFGDWHYEATVANRKTSHASGLYFGDIDIKNLATSGSDGAGIGLVGAASALIENVRVDTAKNGIQFRPGEALYYNPGTPDAGLVKRCITLRNIQAKNITSTGLVLIGAESKSGGYLVSESLTDSQQRDLMRFSADGGVLSAAGSGLYVSGPCDVRNVTLNGAASSGQLAIGDDCIRGVFTNIEVLNGTTTGVRASMGDTIGGMTARLKTLTFNECRVAGNTTGYSFANTKSVRINGGRIGYQLAVDGQNEDPTTGQGVGVSVDQTTNGGGVYCYGVDVTPKSGSVAYSITGTITNPCGVFNPKGTVTFTGAWDIDGVGRAAAGDIAVAANYPNTAGKYLGRMVYDTSNTRLMIAQGPLATDAWKVADNGATVTPA